MGYFDSRHPVLAERMQGFLRKHKLAYQKHMGQLQRELYVLSRDLYTTSREFQIQNQHQGHLVSMNDSVRSPPPSQ